jgi:pimeloyl-ACP methyl ester carboxylesterase
MATVQRAKTSYVETNGISYAYRILGPQNVSTPPLLLLQFFRASIDFWDPLLVSILAKTRCVVLFDNAGVGHSTGEIPDSITEMARHVTIFVDALGYRRFQLRLLLYIHSKLFGPTFWAHGGLKLGCIKPSVASPYHQSTESML